MPKTRTRRWDTASYLKDEQEIVAYLQAALDDGDASVITTALGDIARAKGMSRIARKAGLGRESLYKALSPEGSPEFGTVLRVLEALGMGLRAVPTRERSKVGPRSASR